MIGWLFFIVLSVWLPVAVLHVRWSLNGTYQKWGKKS